MQADRIISSPLTEEISQKGHQSIRFHPDGFSILVSDASYAPVLLSQFRFDPKLLLYDRVNEYCRVLEEDGLLHFEGETVLIEDSMAMTLVPESFHDPALSRELLSQACPVDESEQVLVSYLKNRGTCLLFSQSSLTGEMKSRFHGPVSILHSSECVLSLADQIKSSDHQRGVILAEVQEQRLDLLVIGGDKIRLLNRYVLKDPSEFIYHTLNTLKQLDLDRESIPVYLSGIIHQEHELYGLLGKYIRHVELTPYYLEHLSREQIQQFMILSEGSKCV